MLTELARKHRQNPTETESIMWQMLRVRFCGARFRRQQPIAGYIADFACLSKKLVIEIDGGYHFTEEQKEEDRVRTEYLNSKGYTVLRFTNEEVIADTDNVLQKIRNYIIKELA